MHSDWLLDHDGRTRSTVNYDLPKVSNEHYLRCIEHTYRNHNFSGDLVNRYGIYVSQMTTGLFHLS
jgi:hypothetical protein